MILVPSKSGGTPLPNAAAKKAIPNGESPPIRDTLPIMKASKLILILLILIEPSEICFALFEPPFIAWPSLPTLSCENMPA
jgi:hypothetical protein